MHVDDFLQTSLDERIAVNALRTLHSSHASIDFCSNDYLGIATHELHQGIEANHGSKGSRLLAGNYPLAMETETTIATYHHAEAALIFNSGYDANMGVLSSIPQKTDTIIYDQLCHASIRDGIRLCNANAFSFIHNNMDSLEQKCKLAKGHIFIVTESVFSMDGDCCPLQDIVGIAKQYHAHIILDEAHAVGVIGVQGEGFAQSLQVHQDIFCRIYTYGKAGGCHGAAVVGSKRLQQYLINFARSFIYTTALPPISCMAIQNFYTLLPQLTPEKKQLTANIELFKNSSLSFEKLISDTAIQGILCNGNELAKSIAQTLQQNDIDVRAVLYPTVPKGKERLRIIIHSFNTTSNIHQLIHLLQ